MPSNPAARVSGRAAHELEKELRAHVRGEVRFDKGNRALYATDLSVYRQVPIGVVIPRSPEDAGVAVEICRRHRVPILGRGCGTSLAGQTCNAAVVIDFSRHVNRLLELSPEGRYAWVEPGLICDHLKGPAAKYNLTYPAAPATHAYCTLGGMIGNNSCGAESFSNGKTVENIEELEVLTYDGLQMRVGATSELELARIIREGGRRGEIYRRLKSLRDRYARLIRERFPRIPRRVSGYNLDQLLPENGFHVARALVGTESTCAIVLRAKARLVHLPPCSALLIIGYPHVAQAGDHVADLRNADLKPWKLEAFHRHVIENKIRKDKPITGAELLPEGNAWLLAEYRGEVPEEAAEKAHRAASRLRASDSDYAGIRLLGEKAEQDEIWELRESGVGASRVPGVENAWPSWEDSAVPPERLGAYLRDFDKLVKKFGFAYTLFGHFGDGCIHSRIAYDLKSAEGVKNYRRFLYEAADLVVAYGGSLSGEHGDGHARAELLPKMFGEEIIQAFREFKSIWDPMGMMNPGKVVDPYPLDSHLRMGPEYRPKPVLTHFQFPEDHGSFAEATERCFGVGKCRRTEGGTMCPSFMVTRDEKHTTRGRAHLLFEMLRGDEIRDGWKDEAVKESLDLCLSCKGCKGDCPVSVDMATYKAEFLSHYYEGRPLPRQALAMGLVFKWAALGAKMPGLANFMSRAASWSGKLKELAGIAPEREIPALAPETFKQWFFAQRRRNPDGPAVLLWADTFNNYFKPHTAKAAVEVLEAGGYRVLVPRKNLCCGRPLYDYGMLDRAKAQLREILETLRPFIAQGVPVIGLEPSCLAVFRDELTNLMPRDLDAQRLKRQSFLLSEFLAREMREGRYQPPRLERAAVVHGHCHQKAIMGMDSDQELLSAMGLTAELLDSGCCGMAGSFGFEKDKYEISMKVGERVLLPKVRSAPKERLVIADGFSCREQVSQATDREPLHLAEVIQMALHEGPQGKRGEYPEKGYVEPAPEIPSGTKTLAFAAGCVLALVGAYLISPRRDARS